MYRQGTFVSYKINMKIVNTEEFNELRKNGKVVVDFFADWCGPCKMLSPVLEEVGKEYPDVSFVKVNVDENEELAAEFGIMSIPAVFMLKDGEVVNSFLGFNQERFLRDQLNKAFR